MVVGLHYMVVPHSSIIRGRVRPWSSGSRCRGSVHARLLQFRLHILLRNRHGWLRYAVNKCRGSHRGYSTSRNAILLRCIWTLHRDVIHASIWVKCRRLLLLRRLLRDSLLVIRLDWNECARGWVVNEMLISSGDRLLWSWLVCLLRLRRLLLCLLL